MQSSPSIQNISTALVAVLPTLENATRDKKGQVGKQVYQYADLGQILEIAKPALAKHGVVILQRAAHYNANGVTVQTTLLHSSGEWISDDGLYLPASNLTPQQFGSAVTYARRYGLAALLGITQEDDDGASASGTTPAKASDTPTEAAESKPVKSKYKS